MKLKYLAQFNNISESIEKYEGIVGATDEINELLSAYRYLDLKAPLPGCLPTASRELIHQGPLKLRDAPKSFDVHCFLFTDLLLITQLKKTKKYKIIRPPVLTSRILVRELTQTDKAFVVVSLNDYKVPESVCMFVSSQAKKWIELLELARSKYLEEMAKAAAVVVENSARGVGAVVAASGEDIRRDSAATITVSENEEQRSKSNSGDEEGKETDSNCDVRSSNSFKSCKSGE